MKTTKNLLFLLCTVIVLTGCMPSSDEPADTSAEETQVEQQSSDDASETSQSNTEGFTITEAELEITPMWLHIMENDPMPSQMVDLFMTDLDIPAYVVSTLGNEFGSAIARYYPFTDSDGTQFMMIDVEYETVIETYNDILFYKEGQLVFVEQYYGKHDKPKTDPESITQFWVQYQLSSGEHALLDATDESAVPVEFVDDLSVVEKAYDGILDIEDPTQMEDLEVEPMDDDALGEFGEKTMEPILNLDQADEALKAFYAADVEKSASVDLTDTDFTIPPYLLSRGTPDKIEIITSTYFDDKGIEGMAADYLGTYYEVQEFVYTWSDGTYTEGLYYVDGQLALVEQDYETMDGDSGFLSFSRSLTAEESELFIGDEELFDFGGFSDVAMAYAEFA